MLLTVREEGAPPGLMHFRMFRDTFKALRTVIYIWQRDVGEK